MSRQTLIEVLERIYVDPVYRRLLRESPEVALAGYDLDLEERCLLAAYPRCCRRQQSGAGELLEEERELLEQVVVRRVQPPASSPE